MPNNYDFGGWATRNDIKCADGRTIRRNAFADNDGMTVPLVWQHIHNDPDNVLGHALLENRDEGVYAYCAFNKTAKGQSAKDLVMHGDVKSLSIYANQLKQRGGDVLHGAIREVSLVLAGANPGAYIDSLSITHSTDDSDDDEVIIYTDENITLAHSEEKAEEPENKEEPKMAEKTVKDVFDSLTEEQKNVVYYMIGQALGGEADTDEGDDADMKHNVFESEQDYNDTLVHDGLAMIIRDFKSAGSMKESFLRHADEYGITNIDYLFPEYENLDKTPQFIQRKMEWVATVMGGVHHTPFSRIKSMFADITADEARAKGYIKGKRKKEEVFGLLKRTTDPQTIYKKQKLDRDDIVDITDFDVVAWLKTEMRMMLDEELARAILIGDGRNNGDDDKIQEAHVRPIWTDDDLYTIHYEVKPESGETLPEAIIRSAIKARETYRGSGSPKMFTTEGVLTDMLLLKDLNKRYIYESENTLSTTLRVSNIVTVPVMDEIKKYRHDSVTNKDYKVVALIVNLSDYNVGADKGGAVNMFDDFDIDYNQQKYLIETRCSGALTKPYSAIAPEVEVESQTAG